MEQQNTILKKRTAWLSIMSNSALVILKLVVGLYVGAVSLISEAMHSGVDLIAAVIAFWAVHKSVVPPDQEHDYGHGKYENLSAAIEALLIVFAALAIIYEAIDKFSHRTTPQFLEYGLVIMGLSIVINFFVARRLISVAHKTGSQALEADGLHLQADIWTSIGVMLGLAGMKFLGWVWLDPLVAVVVAVIIFKAGYKMVVESAKELTDASLPPEDEAKIGEIIDRHVAVAGYHCLRTRRSGAYRLLDVHVLFDKKMPLETVHDVCDELEEEIKQVFGSFDVLIHAEPSDHEPENKRMQYEKSQVMQREKI